MVGLSNKKCQLFLGRVTFAGAQPLTQSQPAKEPQFPTQRQQYSGRRTGMNNSNK